MQPDGWHDDLTLDGPTVGSRPDTRRIMERVVRRRRLRFATTTLIAACGIAGVLAVVLGLPSSTDELSTADRLASSSTSPPVRPSVEPGSTSSAPTSVAATVGASPGSRPSTGGSTPATTSVGSDPAPTSAPMDPAPTSATTMQPYDFITPLPHYASSRGWPFAPSPPYTLHGDPRLEHGDLLGQRGCVWLEDTAGATISVLWPAGWTARFSDDGSGMRIEVRDELSQRVASNATRVGIVGGPTEQAFSHCRVRDVAYEVIRIAPH